MHLINNINPIVPLCRRILHLIPDIPDIFHAVVGSSVDLHHIQGGTGTDIPANPAAAAGTSIHRLLTIYCPGKYFCNTGLTGASGAAKQIGMTNAP